MRRALQQIVLLLALGPASVALHAQYTTDAPLHLQAFPFGTGNVNAPLDLMVDDHGYVWLLAQRGAFCMMSDGLENFHTVPSDVRVLRWQGANNGELLVATSAGTLRLSTGGWHYDPQRFIFTDTSSLREVDLPDGRHVQLTDTGSLVIRSGDRVTVQALTIGYHTNYFRLIPGDQGRMLFDPRNGIWILGRNGLMLASTLAPTFPTFDTPVPFERITQVVEDVNSDRRLILSNSRGVLVEELSTGRTIKHIAKNANGERIGGTKWHFVDGRHFFHGNHEVYEYDPSTDSIHVLLDVYDILQGRSNWFNINDLAWNSHSKYLYIGTKDNKLIVLDPESGRSAVHNVKPEGTFSGINLILETEPFGKDRALVIAEHGQFLIDGMDGPVRPAQEEWPAMQFGANFRASSATIIGDTLVVVASFADGLFLYNIGKDSLYRPDGPDMDQLLITDIFWDGLRHVYGATRDGLLMYDVRDNTVRMLNGKQGVPLDNLYYRYMNFGKPGEMFLGLTDRYTRFTTADLDRENTDDLFIETWEVNGHRVKDPPYRALGATVKLGYLENSIGLRLGTPLKLAKPLTSLFVMLNGRTEQMQFHEARDLIQFLALAPGTHHIRMAFTREGPFTDLLTVVITPPAWRSWWFITLIVAGLAGVVYFIFRLRVRHVRHEAQLKADFDSRVTQLELISLRAQMHPHFIFNSLNSIKSFIAGNEPRTATRYLNKFAQLIRSILNNSRHARVDLRSELKALELYVELEQMRFENSFEFSIAVAPGIDQDEVTLPPLILQPYAENAIWHGLMHKEGERRLTVTIERNRDMLQARIRDNGIGREAAKTYRSKIVTKHKSLGMKITAEIIQRTHDDGSTGVTIKDLKDESGNAIGTEVTLSIPLEPRT